MAKPPLLSRFLFAYLYNSLRRSSTLIAPVAWHILKALVASSYENYCPAREELRIFSASLRSVFFKPLRWNGFRILERRSKASGSEKVAQFQKMGRRVVDEGGVNEAKKRERKRQVENSFSRCPRSKRGVRLQQTKRSVSVLSSAAEYLSTSRITIILGGGETLRPCSATPDRLLHHASWRFQTYKRKELLNCKI